jgi:hypothetical protein
MTDDTGNAQVVRHRYQPVALYYHDSDCVEYVREDSLAIYDRVDMFLTLIYDRTGLNLIGFKLKGFKHLFTQALMPAYRLNEEQFVSLVSAIEAICTLLGEQLFADEKRAYAYKAARKIADNDNVRLHDAGLMAA